MGDPIIVVGSAVAESVSLREAGTRVPPAAAEFPPEEVPTAKIQHWGVRRERASGRHEYWSSEARAFVRDIGKARRFLSAEEAAGHSFPGEEPFPFPLGGPK